MPIAGLPWYDLPELRAATDAWWSGIASAMRKAGIGDVPAALTRDEQMETLWERPDLLLMQVCGYNLVTTCRGKLTYIATPCFSAPGCEGASYRSHIVVADQLPAQSIGELRGLRCAINSYASHSGCNSLRGTVLPLAGSERFFSSVVESGGHVRSLELLRSGQADVAAIDCITHALLKRVRPHALLGVRTVAQTEPAPTPPYVAQANASGDLTKRLRGALMDAANASHLIETRAALLLTKFEVLDEYEYDSIGKIELDAAQRGFRDLDRTLSQH